jgi:translation initiation factor 4A
MAPTRELADQIHTVAAALSDCMGIRTHCAVGGRPVFEDVAALRKGVHVLVGTPGRITGLIEKGDLRTSAIKTCILDEADQMLEDNFEEQIRNVCQELPRDVQLCLFSATLPVQVHEISQQFMRDPVRILIKREEVTLDGIKQYYVNCERSDNKLIVLLDIYSSLSITQAIIYCNTRRQVDWLKSRMTEQDFSVSEFHAEMSQSERDQVLKEFRTGSTRVLIATDILARGIDVQQVSMVINFDLPLKKESYIHRIGRAGRFGRKGVAINFATDKDIHELQHIQRFYDTQIDELPGDLAKL